MAQMPMVQTDIVETGTVIIPSDIYTSARADIKKKDGIVTLAFTGNISTSATVAGSNATLMTLPVGFRPSTAQYAYCYGRYRDNEGMYSISINTDGTIKTATGGGTYTGYVTVQLSFFL